MIILLNGASSSGKTSIAKELQIMSDILLLNMGCDKFMSMVPAHYQGVNRNSLWKWVKSHNDHGECMTIDISQRGKKYIAAAYECIALMARRGFNIIVDDVWLDKNLLLQIAPKLNSYTVYFVGVTCQLHILEERERLRGNRIISSARGQHDIVHHFYEYDLKVDTSETNAHDCAQQIKKFIEKNSEPKALKEFAKI